MAHFRPQPKSEQREYEDQEPVGGRKIPHQQQRELAGGKQRVLRMAVGSGPSHHAGQRGDHQQPRELHAPGNLAELEHQQVAAADEQLAQVAVYDGGEDRGRDVPGRETQVVEVVQPGPVGRRCAVCRRPDVPRHHRRQSASQKKCRGRSRRFHIRTSGTAINNGAGTVLVR